MFLPRGASAGGQDIPKMLKLEMQRETPHKLLSKVPPCYRCKKSSLQFREILRGKLFLCPLLLLTFFYFPIFTVYYYRKAILVELHMASELGNPLQQRFFRLYMTPRGGWVTMSLLHAAQLQNTRTSMLRASRVLLGSE